jgi:arylsulfatase A-like enzyme
MLAKVFREGGYRTVHFGKNHLELDLDTLGFDDGRITDRLKVDDQEATARGFPETPPVLCSDYVAYQEATAWLDAQDVQTQPLFFTFSTNLPHPPFFAEPDFIDRFDPAEVELPSSFGADSFAGKPPFQRAHLEDGRHGALEEAALRTETAEYYSMIAATDAHIGGVIERFKKVADWENTIVLFFADHGDMMGSHSLRLKGTLPYDELYRIPCLLKLPSAAVTARAEVDDLVDATGFAASLMTLAGLPVPDGFAGPCLADACARSESPADELVFIEHYAAYWGTHPFYGVRTRTHKYVRYYGTDACEEMYDLARDPDELHNIAGTPGAADEQARLAELADDWWRRTGGRDFAHYDGVSFREQGKRCWAESVQA